MKRNKKSSILGSFDNLYKGIVSKLFGKIADKRADNSSYELEDALKSGFAIYSLKSPSLFSFRKRSKAEDSNLNMVYGINKIPSDNGLRKILDGVDPKEIRKGFHHLFKRIHRLGILDNYRFWRRHIIVSVDGVEHFCSKTIDCPHCLKRTHRDGNTSNYHCMLSAAIVHPDKKEVFIINNEPIINLCMLVLQLFVCYNKIVAGSMLLILHLMVISVYSVNLNPEILELK